jgi:hypothetical protein
VPTLKNKSEVNDPLVKSRRYEVLRPKTDWKLCYRDLTSGAIPAVRRLSELEVA